jgi:hypothetical protein
MKISMKILAVLTAVVLVMSSNPEVVKANGGSFTVNGKWAGTAFASVLDLNNDGVKARTFQVPAYGQLAFTALEGAADTGLVALPGQGSCSNPNAIELQAFGSFTFRGRNDDALFAQVPANAPHLCFDAANPNEVLTITLAGGTGRYANATGTGTLTLHDIVRLTTPVVIQGIPLDAPVMIDTRGEFSLTIQ